MPVCRNGPSAYRYVTPLAAGALEQLDVLQRTGFGLCLSMRLFERLCADQLLAGCHRQSGVIFGWGGCGRGDRNKVKW